MTEIYAIEYRRGVEAHIELLCGAPVKFVMNESGEHELRSTQTNALLFKGKGHGLNRAYMDYLGENEPYFLDDNYFYQVLNKVEKRVDDDKKTED